MLCRRCSPAWQLHQHQQSHFRHLTHPAAPPAVAPALAAHGRLLLQHPLPLHQQQQQRRGRPQHLTWLAPSKPTYPSLLTSTVYWTRGTSVYCLRTGTQPHTSAVVAAAAAALVVAPVAVAAGMEAMRPVPPSPAAAAAAQTLTTALAAAAAAAAVAWMQIAAGTHHQGPRGMLPTSPCGPWMHLPLPAQQSQRVPLRTPLVLHPPPPTPPALVNPRPRRSRCPLYCCRLGAPPPTSC
jgi:hypothetical protein